MILIYGHIFIIIRRHQVSRRALTNHSVSLNSRQANPSVTGQCSLVVETAGHRPASLRYHPHHQSSVASSAARRLPNGKTAGPFHRQRSTGASCSLSTNSDSMEQSNSVVTRNVKV